MRVQTGYTVNKIQARLELEGRSPSNQPSLPLSPSAEGRNTFAIRAKCIGKRLKRWGVVGAISYGKTKSVSYLSILKCKPVSPVTQ